MTRGGGEDQYWLLGLRRCKWPAAKNASSTFFLLSIIFIRVVIGCDFIWFLSHLIYSVTIFEIDEDISERITTPGGVINGNLEVEEGAFGPKIRRRKKKMETRLLKEILNDFSFKSVKRYSWNVFFSSIYFWIVLFWFF